MLYLTHFLQNNGQVFHNIHAFHKAPETQYLQGFPAFLLFSFFLSCAIICFALKNKKIGENMTPLTIYQDNSHKTTVVSNYFIDEYMSDANAAQIKIYLYLLRQMGEGLATSVCEMADFLNYPEKDIVRALKYWEKQGILSLDVDEKNQLTGIHMLPFPESMVNKKTSTTVSLDVSKNVASTSVDTKKPTQEQHTGEIVVRNAGTYVKPVYSLDDLKQFKEKDSTSELIFIIESYLRRTLSGSDLQTIYFFSETLKMSDDLIDYLFQYCIERGKSDFHYIEKVAINWVENGIKTPTEAKEFSYKYAKIVYTVMKALGKATVPTEEEASYVHTWSKDLGFTDDIILEACKRSVTGTDKNRLQYADTILKSWKNNQVITINDIEKLDEDFKKRKTSASGQQKPNYKKGSFYQFEQRDYDFDALEKQLLTK